jgi:hypothetical protein
MPGFGKIRSCQMKPGDRVIWIYSKKRSSVVGCGEQWIPAVIIRVCKRRIRLKVLLPGSERLVKVNPANVICSEES